MLIFYKLSGYSILMGDQRYNYGFGRNPDWITSQEGLKSIVDRLEAILNETGKEPVIAVSLNGACGVCFSIISKEEYDIEHQKTGRVEPYIYAYTLDDIRTRYERSKK